MFPLLAIETSGELCSVCVFENEKNYSEVNLNVKNVHAKMLVPLAEQSLKDIGLLSKDIKTVAVSIGPGSFTGLRIGLATAKGIATGSNAGICPVGTFDALALKIAGFLPVNKEFLIVSDANLNELYFARYKAVEGGVENIASPSVLSKAEFEKKFSKTDLVFGNVNSFKNVRKMNTGAVDVAKWALRYGRSSVTKEFDFLEPEYFQQFIPKVKK